jgi:hypothetical protein
MSFAGPLFAPSYASSTFAQVFGALTGIPEIIGEVATALWLTIMGGVRVRTAAAPVAAA